MIRQTWIFFIGIPIGFITSSFAMNNQGFLTLIPLLPVFTIVAKFSTE